MEGAVRTFSPTLQIQVKSKISALVSEIELKNLEEQNNLPTTPISRPMIPNTQEQVSSVQKLHSQKLKGDVLWLLMSCLEHFYSYA